jgi:hypothetical protein
MGFNLFIRDEAGIWWLININTFKTLNISKFLNEKNENIQFPNLDYFINRRKGFFSSIAIVHKL